MPFYVSPEQAMKDKADYARKGIARGRSGVVIQYDAGILFVAPNPSRALHKISEIYDRIAFAAVGSYNEYEILRKAGVRYADLTGYQYDRQDVTARGLANWYAQTLGTIFTDSPKPFEVEIVVAEVAEVPAEDQIYRITFDGSVNDEHGFVAMGGQADAIATVLKEHYTDEPDPVRRARGRHRRPRGPGQRRPDRDHRRPARGGGARPSQGAPHLPPADRRAAGGAARRGRPGRRRHPAAGHGSAREGQEGQRRRRGRHQPGQASGRRAREQAEPDAAEPGGESAG